MGWSWAVACGVQGRGHIAWLHAQLVRVFFGAELMMQFMCNAQLCCADLRTMLVP